MKMAIAAPPQLREDQIKSILDRPNGEFLLLEYVRLGQIDAEEAVTEIEKRRKRPLFARIAFALLDALTSK
jgi:hypothetical protein